MALGRRGGGVARQQVKVCGEVVVALHIRASVNSAVLFFFYLQKEFDIDYWYYAMLLGGWSPLHRAVLCCLEACTMYHRETVA